MAPIEGQESPVERTETQFQRRNNRIVYILCADG